MEEILINFNRVLPLQFNFKKQMMFTLPTYYNFKMIELFIFSINISKYWNLYYISRLLYY